MKRTFYLKSIFLLCLLLAGAVSAHADGFDYDCEKITDLSQVGDGETVLLVDQSKNLALSPSDATYGLKGVEIAIGEDNVIRNMPANIIWTLEKYGDNSFYFKNNDNYLWGSMTTPSVGVSNPTTNVVYEFLLGDYGDDGGKLYYVGDNGPAYFSWSQNEDNLISIVDNTTDLFTLYKISKKNYVKWKKVGIVEIEEGDTVAIVDLTTATAMSNDKADKDPDAVTVTLNDDKDRILDEVAAKLKWKVERDAQEDANSNKRRFATGDNKYLYADGEQLKVGESENNLFYPFTWTHYDDNGEYQIIPYLCFRIGDDRYFAGVEEGFMGMGNTWKLKKYENGKVDDAVKDTRFAYFKKFEDTQRIVKIELPEYYNYDLKNKDQYTWISMKKSQSQEQKNRK